jgi:hypothetical protein
LIATVVDLDDDDEKRTAAAARMDHDQLQQEPQFDIITVSNRHNKQQ